MCAEFNPGLIPKQCLLANITSSQKHCTGTKYSSKRDDTTTSVFRFFCPQLESLFVPNIEDSYKVCSDKCALLKRNSTCPHDEHHYNDDEFSSPQLGSLANLLHRHLIWRGNTDTLRVNKVPERRCEIAITLNVCRER